VEKAISAVTPTLQENDSDRSRSCWSRTLPRKQLVLSRTRFSTRRATHGQATVVLPLLGRAHRHAEHCRDRLPTTQIRHTGTNTYQESAGRCERKTSYELSRDLAITQKSTWFMLHRIRLAMQDGSFNKLGGEVEVDETFIGGKARNMHKDKRAEKITGRGAEGKEIVFGMVERGGKVIAGHVDTRKKQELQSIIRERVEAGAAIFSDELKSYDGLQSDYQHAVIDHAVEYANGNVHTNTMENFWSLLKRGLHVTYISVEPFHLFRYLDEQAFRYNNRHFTDAERFSIVMKDIVGRRVTYKQLTGKTEDAYS
jgi:transposase-like protein